MTLLEQLRQRRDTARDGAEQILTRAADEGRDLIADALAVLALLAEPFFEHKNLRGKTTVGRLVRETLDEDKRKAK